MDKKYKYQTSSKMLLANLYTPVGVYLSLRDIYPQSCLMESSDYHGHSNSCSFVGINPIGNIRVAHGWIEMNFPDGETERRSLLDVSPIEMKEYIATAFVDFISAFEVTGQGAQYCGLYGYTAFDAVRYFEQIDVKENKKPEDDAPDIYYILYKDVLVFDHFNNTVQIVSLSGPQQVEQIERVLSNQDVKTYPIRTVGDVSSTLTDEQHKANIRRCVAHCLRGDVFQIVVSRRFVQAYEGDDFNLYRALRSINPSPYLFYFDFGGFRIIGSSPETHNRIVGDKAFIDPIAGTTKRTGDAAQDKKNAQFLLNDPKENAEHVMLVDLARNDLSRTCHNVKVDFYKDLQFYSHVIHLVSRVSGTITDNPNPTAAEKIRTRLITFFNTFPAGTLSGAPKVRAMQIISELEPHNRGAYGGCIGFIGLDGNLNQAIVIRTFISHYGELWFQAESGVVAKSNDQYELNESNNKLGALVKAIQKAQQI